MKRQTYSGASTAAEGCIRLLLIENAMLDALPRSELRDDGVHFTSKGYAILAERILPQVLAALNR